MVENDVQAGQPTASANVLDYYDGETQRHTLADGNHSNVAITGASGIGTRSKSGRTKEDLEKPSKVQAIATTTGRKSDATGQCNTQKVKYLSLCKQQRTHLATGRATSEQPLGR